jgi:Ca-activated chloride channel family protein
VRRVALAVALVLTLAACTHDTQSANTVKLADPGECTPVDVAAAPEVATLLGHLGNLFNKSDASHLDGSQCGFVRVHSVDSPTAVSHLLEEWPDATDDGPAPALWAPASSAWIDLANAQLAARHRAPIVHDATTFARTGVVIAMPQPMAEALGWPHKPIGWRDLARVAAQPRGWAAYGHPEWGEFRLGKANPTRSTDTLLATIAVSRLHDPQLARTLESSVIYYGDDDWPFLDNWLRLDKKHLPLSYVSAVITDQRAVDAYNVGSSNGVLPKPGQTLTKPHTALVAITPSDGASAADAPLAAVDAQWVTTGARAGAQAFLAFALGPQAQPEFQDSGFATGGKPANLGAYEDAGAALADWATIRKPARLLLVFDESDSMGDPADPKFPDGPTKIERAKAALLDALSRLAPDDEVGLRVFTTNADGVKDSNWADVVPIGRLDQQRAQLVNAIKALRTQEGSPLYPAVRGAFDSMNRRLDPARINGVVVLTDGYNEYDPDNNRAALLSHLHEPVRVFTIAYSPDSDLSTLRKIAEATNARVYDASDTLTIESLYASALTNF